jgi:hypothetical protein
MLAVAGCGLGSQPVVGGPGACPSASGNTQLLRSDEHRYCLLHPKGYTTTEPNPQETVIANGTLPDAEHPRATISVHNANGSTASEIAAGIVADAEASLSDWSVRQSASIVGGETAIVLDNLPGQDISRQVIVVRDDQVYNLSFVPTGTETSPEMDELYKSVVDSFRFIP